MENIVLSTQQAKEIAQPIYGEIKGYCLENFERYFPWWLDEVCKEKGKPPMKRMGGRSNEHRQEEV